MYRLRWWHAPQEECSDDGLAVMLGKNKVLKWEGVKRMSLMWVKGGTVSFPMLSHFTVWVKAFWMKKKSLIVFMFLVTTTYVLGKLCIHSWHTMNTTCLPRNFMHTPQFGNHWCIHICGSYGFHEAKMLHPPREKDCTFSCSACNPVLWHLVSRISLLSQLRSVGLDSGFLDAEGFL